MFEPLTLRMPELAERWKMTPVQALEFADVNGLPIYFNFSGLAFFDSNEWCRTHGDQDTRRELGRLEGDITNGELHLLRHARGETGKYDHLTDQDARNLRQSIEASKHRCKIINELLEQREIDRKRYLYRGPIGAGQKTLFEIQQIGKSGWPRFGMPPGRTDLIPLEYLSDSGCEPLTMESLFVVLREVKAAESYFKAKQPDNQPQADTPPAPVVEAPANSPLPVTTGDVAFAFEGLHGWNEEQWKKPLGDKPKWLAACIAIPGVQGVSETRWNPVLIGAALVRGGHAKINIVRARFQKRPKLMPWREAWDTYEADNFDTP